VLRLLLLLSLVAPLPASACRPVFAWLNPVSWMTAIQERFSAPKPPPPKLEAAGPQADARFLVQEKYGYDFDPAFVRPMSRAIERSEAKIKEKLASGETVTADDVYAWMDGIAAVRAAIAREKDPSDRAFGRHHNRALSDIPVDHHGDLLEETSVDFLSPDPDHFAGRHAPFYDAAVKAAKAHLPGLRKSGQYPAFVAFGETFRGSSVLSFEKTAQVYHPSDRTAIPMRQRAVEELARAINDKSIGEAEFVDRLAQAYSLFANATPYERGSPSIIESFYDSALRAKFGKTLGRKSEEPFWQVVLRGANQPAFRGPDFLRCFAGGGYEAAEQ
jgi:hypothetical protein